MNKNNDIIIKRLVLKIIQDKSIRNKDISRDLNTFIKKKFETGLQTMQKKLKHHFKDLVIDKLTFDMDDIEANGAFSEEKFLDSFTEKLNNAIEDNYNDDHEDFNFGEKYEQVISGFETLCKKPLNERESKIFFDSFAELYDKQPELIQEYLDTVLENKVFFDNFFNAIPKDIFTHVVSSLRKSNSKHFSKVFELFNDKIFHKSEDQIIPVNHSLQHLNLNERQIDFIKREVMNNQNLDKILQNDLYFSKEQSEAIKENIVSKDFKYILTKILKLEPSEIELIEKNIKNRNLDSVLKNDIKLKQKQADLVKDSIGAKDLDFVLRNELGLDDEQVVFLKKILKAKT